MTEKSSATPLHKLFTLEKRLENGEIDQGLWISYFPDFPINKVPTCEDCEAFDVCKYNHDMEPVECFARRRRHFK